jgi:hypothetical protein
MDTWLESFAEANFRRSADTAHDLKTPLNVAVLNLELLRMRLHKVAGEDEKIAGYAGALEVELRRLGRIFDVFFLLSTPPKNEGAPVLVDLAPIVAEAAARHHLTADPAGPAQVLAHEARIRQAFQLFFEGTTHVLTGEPSLTAIQDDGWFRVTVAGAVDTPDLELSKLFKFYYSDSAGNPDLSLASARVIAETYGGELFAAHESDKVSVRMSFPLGAR